MKFINKQRLIPDQFSELLHNVAGFDALYNNIKTPLLEILIQEQKGLCAYCNQKIVAKQATIEHLVCQSHNRNLELNYYNLYAVCKGNEGIVQKSHCDKYRANGAGNDYFFPFILFEHCKTTSWDDVNPFFDVEYNPRTRIYSGRIKARQRRIQGYPSIENRINHAIESVLNLNAEILVEARKERWAEILTKQTTTGSTWQDLFDHYLNLDPQTNFHEFVLLSIRKQII